MKNSKPFLLSLPVLLVGILILRKLLKEDGCHGLVEGITIVFLWFIGALLFSVTFVIALKRYNKYRNWVELMPLFTPGGLLVAFIILSTLQADALNSPALLYAEMENGSNLLLRENHTYRLQIKEADWGCIYSGEYVLRADTLVLDEKVENQTGSTFYEHYLVKDQKYLVPLFNDTTQPDTLKQLKIKK